MKNGKKEVGTSNKKRTSENLILIEKTSNMVKDFMDKHDEKNEKRIPTKRRGKSLSRRSQSDISKVLIGFKKDEETFTTEQYETKLERMIGILTKTVNKLNLYQDSVLADEINW